MNIVRCLVAWVCVLIMLGTEIAWPRGEEIKRVRSTFSETETIQHIQAKARTLENLKGHFRQLKSSRLFVKPMESEGYFHWQPPDRLRWEVVKPASYRLIAQGNTILVHHVDLNRASLYHYPDRYNLLGRITGASGDPETFRRAYHVEVIPMVEAENPRRIQLNLEPRSAGQSRYVERIEVIIDTGKWLPQQIKIWETNEVETLIQLSDLEENVEIPENLFSVEPPDGVELQQFGSRDES